MAIATYNEFVSDLAVSSKIDIAEPKKVRYILDKSFFLSLIEGKGIDDNFTRALNDLFVHLLERTNIYILIPVDVLIELEKEGKKWVTNKNFLKFLNFLAIIIEVNPDVEISAVDSVMKLAEKYNQNSTSCLILTQKKEEYKAITNDLTKIVTPKDILFTICMFYGILRECLLNLYNSWFRKIATITKPAEPKKESKPKETTEEQPKEELEEEKGE